MIHEVAPAKVNLILQVGQPRGDGLHEICSLFASIDLADELTIRESPGRVDTVTCPDVPVPNLCHRALRSFRDATDVAIPPLEVVVQKRIPLAAGLGGGSADAAAVLRAANEMAGRPLDGAGLRGVATSVGADVASQIEPGHALVQGAGEVVEQVTLPPMALVLVPSPEGLDTGDVYREADRLGATRVRLELGAVRALARRPLDELVVALENDLEAATLSLRPELSDSLDALRDVGALAALVTGSGPTVFGVFEGDREAERATAQLSGALTARLR